MALNLLSPSVVFTTLIPVDCFTTVSDITARECEQLLEKKPAEVLMNGFEDDFVPKLGSEFDKARKKARKKILDVTNTMLGTKLKDDTVIISVGGRYEYKNKGIVNDVIPY